METDLFYVIYSLLKQSAFQQLLSGYFDVPDDFLESLYAVIEKNIDASSLSVGFLARNLAISKSTLNRRLLTRTGLSANETIRRYRLQKAALLLLSGKNVSEAAYLCGFETPSYFTQCFKEFYKITPKKYAQSRALNSMNEHLRAS